MDQRESDIIEMPARNKNKPRYIGLRVNLQGVQVTNWQMSNLGQ